MEINKYYQYNFKNNNFIKIKNKFKKQCRQVKKLYFLLKIPLYQFSY